MGVGGEGKLKPSPLPALLCYSLPQARPARAVCTAPSAEKDPQLTAPPHSRRIQGQPLGKRTVARANPGSLQPDRRTCVVAPDRARLRARAGRAPGPGTRPAGAL